MNTANRSVGLLVFFTAGVAYAAGAPPFRVVAVTGQQAPGRPAGEVFTQFEGKTEINDLGQVVFSAKFGNPNSPETLSSGIWSDGGGALSLVAKVGDPAPSDISGTVFASIIPYLMLSISNRGFVSFEGLARLPGVASYYGVWQQSADGIRMIQRSGGPAAGLSADYRFDWRPIGWICAGRDGDLAFRALATGAKSAELEGIWVSHASQLKLMKRKFAPTPGIPGGYFSSTPTQLPTINSFGRIAFGDWFSPPPGSTERTGHAGIWSDRSEGLDLIAAPGTHAPCSIPDSKFLYLSPFGSTMNDIGQIAFLSSARGPAPSYATTWGLWFDDAGTVSLRLQTETQAVGVPDGIMLQSISNFVINHDGVAAVYGKLAGPGVDTANDEGIWLARASSTILVAREGDQFAGGTRVWQSLGSPSMNRNGWLVFRGSLADPAPNGASQSCLFTSNGSGAVAPFVCVGDQITVTYGDVREVASLSVVGQSGGEDGMTRWFNDRNEALVWVTFTDGALGLVVATAPS